MSRYVGLHTPPYVIMTWLLITLKEKIYLFKFKEMLFTQNFHRQSLIPGVHKYGATGRHGE